MRILGIAILALIALGTGGCSLFFVAGTLFNGAIVEDLPYVAIPALIGGIICWLSILGIRSILRSMGGDAQRSASALDPFSPQPQDVSPPPDQDKRLR